MIELSGVDVWLFALMFYVIGLGLGYLYGHFKIVRKPKLKRPGEEQ